MSIRPALLEVLSRFDADAWAALANRGLLRRATKDLDAISPSVVEDAADHLDVQVGDHVVRFDQRGPTGANCSCPSASTCQHIVAAGLWLTSQADLAPANTLLPDRLHDELMAIDSTALAAHATGAGLRWARQFVDDLDPIDDVRVEAGQQVLISLGRPRVTFRFMGGGVDALVPDARLPTLARYQAAAVLVYQRAHGVELEPVAPTARVAATNLVETRARFRAATTRLLADTVAVGVSHLSPAMLERYQTAAVWAQGSEYHRVALLLRRLADHVDLMLSRSARADEQRLLDEAATTYALMSALEAGEQPRLVGQARNRYDLAPRLELIGLGGLTWRAASGYRGLTMLFWCPEDARFVSWTDARPDSLRAFSPVARYDAPGPWTGLPSPRATVGARVRLLDAQLSAGGRLSGVESTRATVAAREDMSGALPVTAAWADLASRPVRSLLDQPNPLRDWVVLRPSTFIDPVFDQVGQTLHWGLIDEAGDLLVMTLPWSDETAPAIARLESLGELPAGTLVVARVRQNATGLVGDPLSLVRPGRPGVDALYFDDAPVSVTPAGTRRTPEAPAAIAPIPRQLLDHRNWLQRLAERGTGASAASTAELAARHRALRAVGFELFPTDVGSDPAVALLRSHYLTLQVTALLTGSDEA